MGRDARCLMRNECGARPQQDSGGPTSRRASSASGPKRATGLHQAGLRNAGAPGRAWAPPDIKLDAAVIAPKAGLKVLYTHPGSPLISRLYWKTDKDEHETGKQIESREGFSSPREGHWLGGCADCPLERTHQQAQRAPAEEQQGPQLAPW